MDNRIVIEPAFKIREIARNALAGNWQRMDASTIAKN